MSKIDLTINKEGLLHNIQKAKENNIIIPTIAQMQNPDLIPEKIKEKLTHTGLWDVDPVNLFRISWHNEAKESGGLYQKTPNYVEIPSSVSGVPCRILAMSGKWVDWSSQNFLFSLLIGLVALYMVQEVAEARENGRALQVLFPVGAVLWTFLFQTQLGILVVLAMTAMYFLRERPLWRDILVAVLGLATIPASLSVLLIHFHRPGPTMFPKWIYYAAYPIQLLAIGLIGYFLL